MGKTALCSYHVNCVPTTTVPHFCKGKGTFKPRCIRQQYICYIFVWCLTCPLYDCSLRPCHVQQFSINTSLNFRLCFNFYHVHTENQNFLLQCALSQGPGALYSSAITAAPESTLGPDCEMLPLFWPFCLLPWPFDSCSLKKIWRTIETQSAWALLIYKFMKVIIINTR